VAAGGTGRQKDRGRGAAAVGKTAAPGFLNPQATNVRGAVEGKTSVQIDYNVVHLRTSLVQLFVLLQLNFEEVVQIIELRRFRGAPNDYPFAALSINLILRLY
jgi:hypothetical protein